MTLPVNPSKVLQLFAPLWMLLCISLLVHWQSWQAAPFLLIFVASLPVAAAAGAALLRDRWRLELTPDALVHRTLGATETFAWTRMGPIEVAPAPLPAQLLVRTFRFAYPLDAARTAQERASRALGRRLLCVFGDQSAAETIKTIEAWRALHVKPGNGLSQP
jgi:hypothetical protein